MTFGTWNAHDPLTVGEKMKAVREARGLTQADVAKQLGIAQAHISRLEKGKAKPSGQLIKLFAQTFAVPEKWILSEEETEKPSLESVEEIADAFQTMVLRVALGYLTVLNIEIERTYHRIKEAESAAWHMGGTHPRHFFEDGDFEAIRVPFDHPLRDNLVDLRNNFDSVINSLKGMKRMVDEKLDIAKVPPGFEKEE